MLGILAGAAVGAIAGALVTHTICIKALVQQQENRQTLEFLTANYLPVVSSIGYVLECEERLRSAKNSSGVPDDLDEQTPEVYRRALVMLHEGLHQSIGSGVVKLVAEVNVEVSAYMTHVFYILEQGFVAYETTVRNDPERVVRWKTNYPRVEILKRLQQLLGEVRIEHLATAYNASVRDVSSLE